MTPDPRVIVERSLRSLGGTELLAEVKEFSTGSFGWYLNGKILVPIDGKTVSVQVGMNLTVVGSKEAPKKPEPDAE